LKEVEIDPNVMWIAIVAPIVAPIVALTEIVSIHEEMLPAVVLLLENVRVLEMHLPPVGMSAMADGAGAIVDLLLALEVPQDEEVTEIEVAAQRQGEIVIGMIGMIGWMKETI
jgi:hypothetical protein